MEIVTEERNFVNEKNHQPMASLATDNLIMC
jgi:hypothetical protein